MFDIATAQGVVPREIDAIIERTERLEDQEWDSPVPQLPGWTIADLLDHTGRAAHQQAEAFENLFAGRSDIPEYPGAEQGTRAEITGRLMSGRDRFVNAVDHLSEEHLTLMTPLPFGLVPTPVAVQIAVLEYVYHRWDLEHALGNAAFELAADLAPHGFEFLGGLLPMLAAGGAVPAGHLSFELRSPRGSLFLEHAGTGWQVGGTDANGATCVIESATAALTLFGMGRLDPTDPALRCSGPDAHEAIRFKTYFPGP